MGEFFTSLNVLQIYGMTFIFYFIFAFVFRKFVLKLQSTFKDLLISALFGMLFFVIYMGINN